MPETSSSATGQQTGRARISNPLVYLSTYRIACRVRCKVALPFKDIEYHLFLEELLVLYYTKLTLSPNRTLDSFPFRCRVRGSERLDSFSRGED
jgi:hypothetical protein